MKKLLIGFVALVVIVQLLEGANGRRRGLIARRNASEVTTSETNVTSRPIADLDNTGGWTTTPLWSKVNGVVGSDDGDLISSDGTATSSETFTLDGSTTKDPGVSTGHILRLRSAKQGGGAANYDIIVELRQGYVDEMSQGTLIAGVTNLNESSTTPSTDTWTLTSAEADSITDYSDLQFRGYGIKNGGGSNDGVNIYDVEFEVETP